MIEEEKWVDYLNIGPIIDKTCSVAKSAEIYGNVILGKEVNIWPKCVLRGDVNKIEIGSFSNIQDSTVIHVDYEFPTILGEWTTVGHRCLLHACKIGSECLIGMGSTILDGVEIGNNSIIGANSLVTKNTKIPEFSLVYGNPAKVVRLLRQDEYESLKSFAEKYLRIANAYKLSKIFKDVFV